MGGGICSPSGKIHKDNNLMKLAENKRSNIWCRERKQNIQEKGDILNFVLLLWLLH